jgi:uncharacterized protein DUF4124
MRLAFMVAAISSGLLALPASAQVFRCVAAGGAVSYQQQPCEGTAEGGPTQIPTTFPDHVAARERLAAKEAAADARILKRLEIESAERMARSEQATRERELQAEREQSAPSADGWPVIFAGAPRIHHPIVQPRHLRHDLPMNVANRPTR